MIWTYDVHSYMLYRYSKLQINALTSHLNYYSNYLCATQPHTKLMHIAKAFVGEARTALKVSDTGQGREIIPQIFSFILHSQCAVTHAG